MKTPETTEEVSSHGVEKRAERHNWRTNRLLCQRKTEGGLEKGLANLWSRKKITKKAHVVVGKKPNGKCQLI